MRITQEVIESLIESFQKIPKISKSPARKEEPIGPLFGTVYFGFFRSKQFNTDKKHFGMVCGKPIRRRIKYPSVPFKPMTSQKRRGAKARRQSLEIDPVLLGPRRNPNTGEYGYLKHSIILLGLPDIRVKRTLLGREFEHIRRLPEDVIDLVKEKIILAARTP